MTWPAAIGLAQTVFRELVVAGSVARQPEPYLITNEAVAAEAFARASRPNGILSAVYTLNAAHSCSIIQPSDLVVDLGCGPAALLCQIARLNQAARFVGIDLSKEMLEIGRDRIDSEGLSNVELHVDDISTLNSIASHSVDVVLSSMSMHHLANFESLESSFQSISRVLRPNGRVFIFDFGRLKHSRSIQYFVDRSIPDNEPILKRDYAMSLRAAFSVDDYKVLTSRHLSNNSRMFTTYPSPFLVVIKSKSDFALSKAVKNDLRGLIRDLPLKRRLDLMQLRAFLGMGGLKWML